MATTDGVPRVAGTTVLTCRAMSSRYRLLVLALAFGAAAASADETFRCGKWLITSDLTLATRYGVFFPDGDTFKSNRQRQFFFVSLTYAF